MILAYAFGIATGVPAGIAMARAWHDWHRQRPVEVQLADLDRMRHRRAEANGTSTPLVDQLRREMAAAERRDGGRAAF